MLHAYDFFQGLALAWLPRLAPADSKLGRGLRGRQAAAQRLGRAPLASTGPVIWMHAASVGEYEQARPIARALLRQVPQARLLQTFFSPSGYDYAKRLGESTWFDYVPEDRRASVAAVLERVRPQALVVVKFDLWPHLVLEAHARRIPVLLVDATLQPRSQRSRWPARLLYRRLYSCLDVISAVSEADAARFRRVVPNHPCIVVDGDTRFDQVADRRRNATRVALPAYLRQHGDGFVFLAGSTWPPDEQHIVTAWSRALAAWPVSAPVPRCILVPHEPTPPHLQRLERLLEQHGLRSARLSDHGDPEPPAGVVLIVDRVGVLAELYAAASVAYVGGAFTTGVHNVMEPAIAGLPVLFGPRHHNAPEAEMLLEAGAAGVITSAADLERALRDLAVDPQRRTAMGGRARAFVEANLGASERCARRILAVLPPDTVSRFEEPR